MLRTRANWLALIANGSLRIDGLSSAQMCRALRQAWDMDTISCKRLGFDCTCICISFVSHCLSGWYVSGGGGVY